jgi:hypothetical protein
MQRVKHAWRMVFGVVGLFLSGCSFTDQTPNDVSQKFQQGIEGKGHLVPQDANGATNDPTNSPTAPSAALPAPNPE